VDRLYEKGSVSDPEGKAKSVALTDEGRSAAEHAFRGKFVS
jgi:hypothetical protein